MFDKKSEYALNKYDQDSIIYISVSERSTHTLDPDRHSGRDDSAGVKDTFSRPPTDLRGNPAAHDTNDAAEL